MTLSFARRQFPPGNIRDAVWLYIACSRRSSGRADDGVVEAALTDRLLLKDFVGVGP